MNKNNLLIMVNYRQILNNNKRYKNYIFHINLHVIKIGNKREILFLLMKENMRK